MSLTTGTDPFIGREREMAELTAALDDALEGRGGLAMLTGEPGIGKTRLADELETVARDRGALVSRSSCYEGGGTPPYWPWARVILTLLAASSESVLRALETRGAVIAEIVPDIRSMIPNLASAPAVESKQARFRLFDSVTSFLNELTASQPLVVVLDDLHWADRSSLDLLEFVAGEVSERSMLLVGSYRDMELSRQHPLSETLATLARARRFRRIPLQGLESDDVGRLVEAIGDIALPPDLIEEIHDRTEGNPFFIAEVTRDLAREAAVRGGNFDTVQFRVPEGVREAVGIRLNRLSEECNNALRTSAIIGREFDFNLLAAVNTDLSEDLLSGLIDEALRTSFIRDLPGRSERYEFTHALIQQTLTEELPAASAHACMPELSMPSKSYMQTIWKIIVPSSHSIVRQPGPRWPGTRKPTIRGWPASGPRIHTPGWKRGPILSRRLTRWERRLLRPSGLGYCPAWAKRSCTR